MEDIQQTSDIHMVLPVNPTFLLLVLLLLFLLRLLPPRKFDFFSVTATLNNSPPAFRHWK